MQNKCRCIAGLAAVLILASVSVTAQDAAQKQALQQRLAEVKQSMAENQARLKQYAWVETTEISLKGEVKKREQKNCTYGSDGKVQKISVGGGAPEQAQQGGRTWAEGWPQGQDRREQGRGHEGVHGSGGKSCAPVRSARPASDAGRVPGRKSVN